MKSPKDQRIIQIDITNACQHSCSNCTRFCGHHKKPFFMSFETFKRAVDSLDGYIGTIGMMGGEPTLHPEFEKFATYLGEHVSQKKTVNNFIYPQKHFMRAMHNQELENAIAYDYSTGTRETVIGAGLWSAMVGSYMKHYEIIQDTFRMQAVNDHANLSYHSPILISRHDLGIPDEKWIPMRDNCWMQNFWSATVTPKGAFFCEVAGALDMLLDGPGGWPIEPGWWKRKPEDFEDQLHWCEICGLALDTFSRDAREEIDDMSESWYERLKDRGSQKIKDGRYNVVEIENGKITEDSKESGIRKQAYWLSYEERFNADKSVMYPSEFSGIFQSLSGVPLDEDVLRKNAALIDHLVVITDSDARKKLIEDLHIDGIQKVISWENHKYGYALYEALQEFSEDRYVILMSDGVSITEAGVDALKKLIINPGTLHITHFRDSKNKYFELACGCDKEFAVLFNLLALSLRNAGMDTILNAASFKDISDIWIPSKIVRFDESMEYDVPDNSILEGGKYIIYGTGGFARQATDAVKAKGAEVLFYVNSFSDEQGKKFCGKEVKAPEDILKCPYYDRVIISTNRYFMEMRKTLCGLGIPDEKMMLPIE